ncbi:hypothetical protein [Spirosoma endbachense]|uniref:Uncharacterized protein n=1 Tax=Spirosoma endbachense TaxID=2666025 RepID=A0A6P1VTW5_9BACT|nr:hypothetical protein [Spirosoma endbachense]QHV96054.1 hypothetical protein GJR95_14010 [Spirosoma endbachense]
MRKQTTVRRAVARSGGTHLSESPLIVWFVCCQYDYKIIPSPIVERDGVIFIPTDDVVPSAIDRQTRPAN